MDCVPSKTVIIIGAWFLQEFLQTIHQILQKHREIFKEKDDFPKIDSSINLDFPITLRRTTFLMARINPGMRDCTLVISCFRV